MEHEDHLVIIMEDTYTPLSLVEEKSFLRMVNHLDPSIRPITRSKFTSTLTPQKFKKTETYVSSLLDGVSCVVISYDLWMSKTTHDICSMTSHYTCDHVRDHFHIMMPIKTSTDG